MIEQSDTSSYRHRSLEHAITPHLQWVKKRLEEILADNRIARYSQGDDSATTLVSIGYVLLCSALADSRVPKELAAVTGFHEDFAEAVVAVMGEYQLWHTYWFEFLVFTVHRLESSSDEMMKAFNNATGGFYEVDWPREYFSRFEITRARLVIGGELQNYIDETFFDEFIRHHDLYKPARMS